MIQLLFLSTVVFQGELVASPKLLDPEIEALSATYLIGGKAITLNNGRATREYLPGSASRYVVEVAGAPVIGDLNADGLPDAVLLLVQTAGGSGSFYAVAAAVNYGDRFEGTNAVFLGDRIIPVTLAIEYGLVLVDYLDRLPETPMAASPDLEQSKYLLLHETTLREIALGKNELLIAGEVVLGQEVRTMRPCGSDSASWLLGNSPALSAMQTAYNDRTSGIIPGTPLLMVISGTLTNFFSNNLAVNYPSAIQANRLVRVYPGQACRQVGRE